MRTESLRLLQFCLCIFSLVPLESRAAEPKPTKASAAKPTVSYEIQSSIKGTAILKDGIMGAGVGQQIPGKPGWNDIEVGAPGMARRSLRFWIDTNQKKVLAVDLVAGENKDIKVPPFKSVPPEKIFKTPSICNWYLQKTNDQSFCDRQTLFDDLMFGDGVLYQENELKTLARRGELSPFRHLVARLSSADATIEIEDFYSSHAGQASSAHLNSLHNLLLGDCPRVRALYLDNHGNTAIADALLHHVAICAELQVKADLAMSLLDHRTQGARPDAGLAFDLARLQIRKSVEKAEATATRCISATPVRMPCQQILQMTAALQGKKFKLRGVNNEDVVFKNFLSIEEGLPDQQESLFITQAAQLPTFPHSLENYILMFWINVAHDPVLSDDFYLTSKIQVATIQGGSTLDKVIESLESRGMTKLLPPVYLRKLRSQPEDTNLWYRLIRAYGKANQCEDLLKGMKTGAKYLPKYNANLLQLQGSCLIALNRNPEALEVYQKILEVRPNTWSTHFNLASAYERLGKKNEAYTHFKKTLDFQPPAEVKDAVQQKIVQLRPKDKS